MHGVIIPATACPLCVCACSAAHATQRGEMFRKRWSDIFYERHEHTPSHTYNDGWMAFSGQPTTIELHATLPLLGAAQRTFTQGGQQQSKFQLKWKTLLIETEWMLMLLRLRVQVSAAAWEKKHLRQLFHYLKSAHSEPGSQPRLRLGGTTIIITIRKQTAPAREFYPGKNWMST